MALVSGELVSWVWGRAGIGGEDEKRFIDKRWRRGGFVEARARGFGESRGNEPARSVKGWGGMEEKVVEVVRCEDLGLEDRAPAVDGRPGRRALSEDLEVVDGDEPCEEDGRIPGDARSEWLRLRRLERLRTKAPGLGVDGPGTPFLSLALVEGRGGVMWEYPPTSTGGFGTGGSGFCSSE